MQTPALSAQWAHFHNSNGSSSVYSRRDVNLPPPLLHWLFRLENVRKQLKVSTEPVRGVLNCFINWLTVWNPQMISSDKKQPEQVLRFEAGTSEYLGFCFDKKLTATNQPVITSVFKSANLLCAETVHSYKAELMNGWYLKAHIISREASCLAGKGHHKTHSSKNNVCNHLQKPRPHKSTNFYKPVCRDQQKTVSQPLFMHPRIWLIGCGCCSIFTCIQAHLASSTALINTDSAENTGGCGDVGPGEAVYIEHDERMSAGLGLKMKHERIKVSDFLLQAGGNCCPWISSGIVQPIPFKRAHQKGHVPQCTRSNQLLSSSMCCCVHG